jgi:S-adenosylmethionine:tRNA ribosyltransferase-isomerase
MTVSRAGRIPATDYDFELPKQLIAQHPLAKREDAKLMIVNRRDDSISHSWFRDLPNWMNEGDCLVLNETRVVPARLVGFRKKTGGRWHGLYLEHDEETQIVRLLCKTRGKIEPGETVVLQDREGNDSLELHLVSRMPGGAWAAVIDGETTAGQMLDRAGRVPLPHYIRGGNMVDADLEDYQTVYARNPGSVAAPTAGLHFSEPLLAALIDNGVRIARVNLHVGTGTFKPMTSEFIDDHEMHAEKGVLGRKAFSLIEETRARQGRVFVVGTTSVRLLETAALDGNLQPWEGETSLFIRPGHQFRAVDAMITNFHLPRSTLLVLVRTFGGDSLVRRAYSEAVEARYRFFSYGDAMLIV